MAIHSSTLAWKIPWMEDPGRLQSMGSQRVRNDWETSLSPYMGKLLRLLKCLCCYSQYGPREPWLFQNFEGHHEIKLIVFSVTGSGKQSGCPGRKLSRAGVGCGLVIKLCPTLCDPMDCGLPGSSIHGIFQARVLEWVAIAFPRRSSLPRDWTRVSCTVGRRFTIWATKEVNY